MEKSSIEALHAQLIQKDRELQALRNNLESEKTINRSVRYEISKIIKQKDALACQLHQLKQTNRFLKDQLSKLNETALKTNSYSKSQTCFSNPDCFQDESIENQRKKANKSVHPSLPEPQQFSLINDKICSNSQYFDHQMQEIVESIALNLRLFIGTGDDDQFFTNLSIINEKAISKKQRFKQIKFFTKVKNEQVSKMITLESQFYQFVELIHNKFTQKQTDWRQKFNKKAKEFSILEEQSQKNLQILNNQLSMLKEEVKTLKDRINHLQNLLTSSRSYVQDLQTQNQILRSQLKQITVKRSALQKDLDSLKCKIKPQNFNSIQIQTQNFELENLKIQKSQLQQVNKFYESLLQQIKQIVMRKYKLKLKPQDKQISAIISSNQSIGCKLITSIIIHGHDQHRTDLLAQLEQFMNKNVKRTDLIARYPESKSLIYYLPKEQANFSFLLLYKTAKGKVIGSFSEGLKKKTFIFAFWSQLQKDSQESHETPWKKPLQAWIPQSPSTQLEAIQFVQNRYLQYGRGELRFSCLDMSFIVANSDVMGQSYYKLSWKNIFSEQNQEKIPLSEVQFHRVEFQ